MKLRELLSVYKFERIDNKSEDALDWNTRTVRIYMGISLTDPFFEVGYGVAFSYRDFTKKPNVSDFVSEGTLDRNVDHFYADEDLSILFVFLEDEEYDGEN